jgi:toxin ParE1/3/4
MRAIRLRPEAHRDLESIAAFSESNWGLAQRDRHLKKLNDAFVKIVRSPFIGPARPDLGSSYRSVKIGSHIVFYRNRRDHIEIVRVLHAAMDPIRHLDFESGSSA